jgi:hypothetical protein
MKDKDAMKMFKGKESKAEEMKEAKAVKDGKMTVKQYAKGEAKEGHGKGAAKKGAAIKSGKMTPAQYAKADAMEKKPMKKMANGGMAKKKGKC